MGYILKEYDNQHRVRNGNQHMKMKLSRVRALPKPSENFFTNLCTICED